MIDHFQLISILLTALIVLVSICTVYLARLYYTIQHKSAQHSQLMRELETIRYNVYSLDKHAEVTAKATRIASEKFSFLD